MAQHQAPLATVADVIDRTADRLAALRDEWREGDRQLPELITTVGADTSGYVHLVLHGVRVELDRCITHLRDDFVPEILPYLDPGLRSRLLDLLNLLVLDSYQEDNSGRVGARWRQTWEATAVEPEVRTVVALLEAAAEELRRRAATESGREQGHLPTSSKVKVPSARSRKTIEWLGHAILLQKEHPDWNIPQIAREVGKHRTTLTRNKEFMAIRERVIEGPAPRRGYLVKNEAGQTEVEAIYEVDAPLLDEGDLDEDT